MKSLICLILFFCAFAIGSAQEEEEVKTFFPISAWAKTHLPNRPHPMAEQQRKFDKLYRRRFMPQAEPYEVNFNRTAVSNMLVCKKGEGWRPFEAFEDGEWQRIENPIWPTQTCAFTSDVGVRDAEAPENDVQTAAARSLLRWQPKSCGLPVFSNDELRKCFAERSIAVVGDSVTRQIYCHARELGLSLQYVCLKFPNSCKKRHIRQFEKHDVRMIGEQLGGEPNLSNTFTDEEHRKICSGNSLASGLAHNITHVVMIPAFAHWYNYIEQTHFSRNFKDSLKAAHEWFSDNRPNATIIWTSPTPMMKIEAPPRFMSEAPRGICPSESSPVRNPGKVLMAWNATMAMSSLLGKFHEKLNPEVAHKNMLLNMTAIMAGRIDGMIARPLNADRIWQCSHTCPELSLWALQMIAWAVGCEKKWDEGY